MSIQKVNNSSANPTSGNLGFQSTALGKIQGLASGSLLCAIGSNRYLDSTYYSKTLDTYKVAKKGMHPAFKLLAIAAATVLPMFCVGSIVDKNANAAMPKFNKIA